MLLMERSLIDSQNLLMIFLIVAVLAFMWNKKRGFIRSYTKLFTFMLGTSLFLVFLQINNFFGKKLLADFCNIAPVAISVYLCMGFWQQMNDDIADRKLGESMYATLMVAQGTFYTFVGVSSILIAFTNTSGGMNIAALISGLKLAFLTSVVGILFSIAAKIKMKLGTESYIGNRKRYLDEQDFYDKLEEIKKSSASNLEVLNKQSINNTYSTNNLLIDIIERYERSNKNLADVVSAHITKADENLVKNYKMVSTEIIDNLQDTFGKIADNTKVINDTLSYTGKTVEQFSNKFTALLANQNDFVQKFEEINSALDARSKEYERLLEVAMNLVDAKGTQQQEGMEKLLASQKEYLAVLHNYYEEHKKQLQEFDESLRKHEEITEQMFVSYQQDMNKMIEEEGKKAVLEITGYTNRLVNTSLGDYSNQLREINKKHVDELNQNMRSINDKLKTSEKAFADVIAFEGNITQEYQKQYDKLLTLELVDARQLKVKEEIERKVQEQVEIKCKSSAEVERKALEQAEVERKARIEAEQQAEADRKARAEAEQQTQAERKARAEAEQQAETERQARAEAELKNEAERKARAEAEQQTEAERKARAEAELQTEAERKARAEAELQTEAERKARALAELKNVAERKARAEAEQQTEVERKARAEAERSARKDAERRADAEAELRAREIEALEKRAKEKAEAERKARVEAEKRVETERKAKAEAEQKAKDLQAERERKEKDELERKANELQARQEQKDDEDDEIEDIFD